jgi:hypothetical protein
MYPVDVLIDDCLVLDELGPLRKLKYAERSVNGTVV